MLPGNIGTGEHQRISGEHRYRGTFGTGEHRYRGNIGTGEHSADPDKTRASSVMFSVYRCLFPWDYVPLLISEYIVPEIR